MRDLTSDALNIEPGLYVVAVSGGVDSTVLLDILANRARELDADPKADPGRLRLTVAHYDHGIREDSGEDRLFVQELAKRYGLPFVYDEGRLGADCSEAKAREHRYGFLDKIVSITGADGIITAHHNDDLLETAIINILRGTGPKGLTALKSSPRLLRPLLNIPKASILSYAKSRELEWREDSTNKDEKYLRNYVRQNITKKFSAADRQKLLDQIDKLSGLNGLIDEAVESLADRHTKDDRLDRRWFIGLPHDVARAVMLAWLKGHGANYDKKRIDRLVITAKTLPKGKIVDIDNRYKMAVEGIDLALQMRER